MNGAVAGLLLLAAATANAGEGTAKGDSAACELHVFPPQGVGVVDATQVRPTEEGVLGNAVRDAVLSLFRIKDPKAIALFLGDALPQADQLAWLKAIDYSATSKGQGRIVIVHDEPTDRVTLANYKSEARTASTPATCYAELVFSGSYFEKSTLSQSLKTSYFFRDFADRPVPIRAVLKAPGVGISGFPPDDKAEAETARAEVRRIVQANLLAAFNAK